MLSATFGSVSVATPAARPWIWALLSGAAAVAILHPDGMSFAGYLTCWIAVLISTYVCFLFYNRLDKITRAWVYPFLQFARAAAFTAIVAIEPVGVAALGALVLARWVSYLVYRQTSGRWPEVQPELVTLIAFVLLSLFTACSFGLSVLLTWSALGLLLWMIFRARGDIYAAFGSARRLDRPRRDTTIQRRGHAAASPRQEAR